MALADLLVTTPPLDRGGSTAANRFDFQVNWALCLLLELHKSGTDYVLLMDYHDDVLVLDSASNPTAVTCYQIKTRKGTNWTLERITKREQGKKGPLPSILGRLFHHTIVFPGGVIGLSFVSNASLVATTSANKSTNTLDSFSFSDLSTEDQKQLSDAVCAELQCSSANELTKFAYQRSLMNIEGHEHFAIGALTTFLSELPTAAGVLPLPFYRALKLELSKLQREEGKPGSFAQLCALKSTTRVRFETMLATACAQPRPADMPTDVCVRLNSEGVDYHDVEVMRGELRRLSVERMNATNIELRDAMAEVDSAIKLVKADKLWPTIESVRSNLGATNARIEQRFGLHTLRAMIAALLYEVPQLPRPDPGSAGAQA